MHNGDNFEARRQAVAARAQRSGGVEWATLGLFVGFYVAWLAVILGHRSIPWPAMIAALALLGGFYMSLQHEALHGHPTRWRGVNTALAIAPLSFWLPYLGYRSSHMVHHHTDLTDPEIDPESFYLRPDDWASAGVVERTYVLVTRTMLGRLTLGAVHSIGRYLWHEMPPSEPIDRWPAAGQSICPQPCCSAGGCSPWSAFPSGSICWGSSSWASR